MDIKQREIALRALIDDIKKTKFNPDYDASDTEALGLLLSEFFEWDGIAVLEAASAGLTDANFHTLAAKVDRLIVQEQKRIEREVRAQARRAGVAYGTHGARS